MHATVTVGSILTVAAVTVTVAVPVTVAGAIAGCAVVIVAVVVVGSGSGSGFGSRCESGLGSGSRSGSGLWYVMTISSVPVQWRASKIAASSSNEKLSHACYSYCWFNPDRCYCY